MRRFKGVVCKDGFEMSVQANEGAYCHPRIDDAEHYVEVEVGYPSEREPILMEYIDGPQDAPTDAVYGFVPSSTVALVCAKHGGIVSGELPPGVPYLEAQE